MYESVSQRVSECMKVYRNVYPSVWKCMVSAIMITKVDNNDIISANSMDENKPHILNTLLKYDNDNKSNY